MGMLLFLSLYPYHPHLLSLSHAIFFSGFAVSRFLLVFRSSCGYAYIFLRACFLLSVLTFFNSRLLMLFFWTALFARDTKMAS